MARPTDLVQKISQQFGLPAATVELHSRNLREAGLRSKSPRGRGAGTVSARDAANLLLATVGSRNVKDSALLVERPGGLVSKDGRWTPDFISIPELSALPDQHTFADAIEALLLAAASGSLQSAANVLEGSSVDLIRDTVPALNIEVSILGPTPRGAILIEERVTDEDGGVHRFRDHSTRHFYGNRPAGPTAGNLAWVDLSRPKEMDSDLRSQMTFSHRTLMSIGVLLTDGLIANTAV